MNYSHPVPPDLSIVVPTFNERERLAELVDAVLAAGRSANLAVELIVVDDNSPDGTGVLADELARTRPMRVVRRAGKLGLGTAVVAGFAVAQAPVVGVMDADFSHPPSLVPVLFAAMTSTNADVVVASRYVAGGSTPDWPWSRRLLSRIGCWLARPIAPIHDAASGFFLIRADLARNVAIQRVLERGWYILGPELSAFEDEFAAATGAKYSVGVGTGTDAIALLLRALGVGPGDEVITAPVSAAYSALAIQMTGATPVFADLDDRRMTLDPRAAEAAITPRTKAILPVHLYGQPADLPALQAICEQHHLLLVEDACQSHLATSEGQPVGSFGAGAAYSFYPTKNLGALGDGGAITTGDAALAQRLKRLRNGGQSDRYLHQEFGVNSRLDEMQAAVLRARLAFLPAWTARRRALAARYRVALAGTGLAVPPECDPGHVYHLFPVRSAHREKMRADLDARGVETLIHYPIPLPKQPAFAGLKPADCPNGTRVANEVFSLPLHPQMTEADVDAVAATVRSLSLG